MEYMSTVLVYVYAFHLFTIHVAAKVCSPLYDKASFTSTAYHIGKGGSIQAKAHYEPIITAFSTHSENSYYFQTCTFVLSPSYFFTTFFT